MNRKQFEKEFLIRLAAVWLGCRFAVMGNIPDRGWHVKTRDLAFDLLGTVDYGHEMRLLCDEVLAQ